MKRGRGTWMGEVHGGTLRVLGGGASNTFSWSMAGRPPYIGRTSRSTDPCWACSLNRVRIRSHTASTSSWPVTNARMSPLDTPPTVRTTVGSVSVRLWRCHVENVMRCLRWKNFHDVMMISQGFTIAIQRWRMLNDNVMIMLQAWLHVYNWYVEQ